MLNFQSKIDLVLGNSTDSDEMPYHAAFHLGLHCLLVYGFLVWRGSNFIIKEQILPGPGLQSQFRRNYDILI